MDPSFKPKLAEYYRNHYPVTALYNYLTIHKPLDKREFSFTIGDLYIRYQSFTSPPEIKKKLLSLVPHKIDLGAVFSKDPEKYKSSPSLCALEKEYVIDIDITDYDNVRICGCKEAGYCRKCWKLMNHSMKCLNYMFEQSFGVSDVMWVYSGRRGIHAWVTDPRLFEMDTMGRSAVSEYLHLYTGTDQRIRAVSLGNQIHPMFLPGMPIYESAEKCFLEVYGRDMAIFQNHQHREWLFTKVFEFDDDNPKHIEMKKAMSEFMDEVDEDEEENREFVDDSDIDYRKLQESGKDLPKIDQLWSIKGARKVWEHVKSVFQKFNDTSRIATETIYSLVHPRLDINVSKHLNHLLKAPFCVHPKTGKVCVPIPDDRVGEYYPDDDCPLLDNLVEGNERDLANFRKYVEVMKEHIREVKEKRENEMQDESNLDF